VLLSQVVEEVRAPIVERSHKLLETLVVLAVD
jgi:hypothetical protein